MANTSQGSWQGSGRGWLIGGGVLAAGLLAFILQNRESVSFTWLFWTFNALMWRRHRRRQARRAGR